MNDRLVKLADDILIKADGKTISIDGKLPRRRSKGRGLLLIRPRADKCLGRKSGYQPK